MKRVAIAHDWGLMAPPYAVEAEVADGRLHRLDVAGLEHTEEIVLLRRATSSGRRYSEPQSTRSAARPPGLGNP